MFEYRHNKCVGPHSPAARTFNKIMETKKDVGVKFLSAPIPTLRLSHCPLIRISNVKACPRRAIYTLPPDNPQTYIYTKTPYTGYTLLYINEREIRRRDIFITHANASVASPLYQDSNLRDLSEQTGNVKKTSFRD